VLHRFGVLDGDKGAAALTTAISRARGRTTVVCCFTADDLIVDRLRTAGARLLRDVLLAAGGKGTASVGRVSSATDGLVTDLRDRLAAAGLPVQVRVGDGSWPLDLAVADPRVPGRMLVAVDLDGPAFASRACRERERSRPARWERAGWAYCKVSALDLFSDPALEVARIRDAWTAAMDRPLPPEVYSGGAAPAGSLPSSFMNGPEDDDQPVLPVRSGDDTDEGWGGHEPQSDSDDRDEQFRRDRPPHWD
jgi:REase_MTES_1575